MKWKKGFWLLPLCMAAVQCKKGSLHTIESGSGPTNTVVLASGSYVLLEYTRSTEFGVELTEQDFESLTGTLVVTPALILQTLEIDGDVTETEMAFHDLDIQANPPSGGVTINANPFAGVYFPEGTDLVIETYGTTQLGVNYTETIRWHKLSDFPGAGL